MEDGDIIKIILGLVFVFVATIGKKKLGKVLSEATSEDRTVRSHTTALEDAPVCKITHPVSTDNTETSIKAEHVRHDDVSVDPAITDIKENFDIKKAILYKEILEPKYKQY